MPKPWGKYEIDYLDHPKFRALNANAIVLWLEAKNHCDKFQTDGRFPREVAKTFRYYSTKAVELLTRSCGVKPNGDAYTPLWMAESIGGVSYYQMHDYLDYNDCRDAVLARIAKSDEDAKRKATNQKEYRDRQKAERAAARAGNGTDNVTGNEAGHATDTRAERSACVPDKQQQKQKQKHPFLSETDLWNDHPKTPPMNLGLNRLKFWRWMAEEFITRLGDHAEAFDIEAWVCAQDRLETGVLTIKNWWAYWEPLFDAEVQRRRLPTASSAPIRDREAEARAESEAVLAIVRGAQG